MSLSIIQSAKYEPGSTGNSIPFVLGSTPTPGNILIAFTSFSQYGGSRTCSPPSGAWTSITSVTEVNDSITAWWYLVQSGDGKDWTFNISGSNEWQSGVIYEIAGADPNNPIDKEATQQYSGAGSFLSASVTPSIIGDLALYGLTTDGGYTTPPPTITSGWTVDQFADPNGGAGYHTTAGAHQNALTTDTSTPISTTYHFDGFASNGASIILLVAPLVAVTRNLSTACAAASTVSAPIAAITRPLISSPAAVSAVASPILAITRALQESVAAGSVTSTPSLLILRALISAISGVSGVGTPNLAVVRPLSSSLSAISTVATPNLLIQRALTLLAAAVSTTSEIDILLNAIPDLVTTIAVQSQVSSPALQVVRPLSSTIVGQTQGSAAILAVLRTLTATITSGIQALDITLKVLRELATTISCESVTSDLALINTLSTVIYTVSTTPVITLKVLRDLTTVIAAISALSEIDLAYGVSHDLITAIAAYTMTSEIEVILTFHESLRVQGKRFYGLIDSSGLRGNAVKWAPKNYLLDDALKWIVEEEKKAA